MDTLKKFMIVLNNADKYPTEHELAEAALVARGKLNRLVEQHDAALKLLKAAICPACDGSGVIIEEHIVPRCCGNYRGNGDCCSEPIPIQELEYQECQWCAERTAIFAPKEGK